MKKKNLTRKQLLGLSVLLFGLVVVLLSAKVPMAKEFFANLGSSVSAANGSTTVHYFNSDVQKDDDKKNDWNFGPNRYDAKKDLAMFADEKGNGDFFASIEKDPALTAAVALHMDSKLNFAEPILKDEQNELVGQRADKAHLHFLKDPAYWQRAKDLIKARLTRAEIKLSDIKGDYTSSMYMAYGQLEGDKPSVVVRNSVNAGGHFLSFDFGPKVGLVRFRLECGYQPVDLDYWPVPKDFPGVPDNPKPVPQPKPEPKPEPKPNPEPNPKPNPEPNPKPNPEPNPKPNPEPNPEPKPTPEPKDPAKGPQAQVKAHNQSGAEDFNGGANTHNYTEVTPEPVSPSKYEAPSAPSYHNNSSSLKTPKSLPKQDDFPSTPPTVEPTLSQDGVNTGDLDPSAVE